MFEANSATKGLQLSEFRSLNFKPLLKQHPFCCLLAGTSGLFALFAKTCLFVSVQRLLSSRFLAEVQRWVVYVSEQFDSQTFNRGWNFNTALAIASAAHVKARDWGGAGHRTQCLRSWTETWDLRHLFEGTIFFVTKARYVGFVWPITCPKKDGFRPRKGPTSRNSQFSGCRPSLPFRFGVRARKQGCHSPGRLDICWYQLTDLTGRLGF